MIPCRTVILLSVLGSIVATTASFEYNNNSNDSSLRDFKQPPKDRHHLNRSITMAQRIRANKVASNTRIWDAETTTSSSLNATTTRERRRKQRQRRQKQNHLQRQQQKLRATSQQTTRMNHHHRWVQSTTITTQVRTVLAIRIKATDSVPTVTPTEITNALFSSTNSTTVSLNAQMMACSLGTLSFVPQTETALVSPDGSPPASVITFDSPGVWTITIAAMAAEVMHYDMVSMALARATELTGILDIRNVADHVLFVVPPNIRNKESFLASAEVGSSQSIFVDTWSISLSGLMHEMGHNLGLYHSATWDDPYGDVSGYMGKSIGYNAAAATEESNSSSADNAQPLQCYNAQNFWQLSWYVTNDNGVNLRTEIDVTDPTTESKLIEITAFVDATKIVASNSQQDVVLVKVNNMIYMQYNRAKSYNVGTRFLPDQLVVVYDDTLYGAQEIDDPTTDTLISQQGTITLAGLDLKDVDTYSGYNITIEICDMVSTPTTNDDTKDSMMVSIGHVNQPSACPSLLGNDNVSSAPVPVGRTITTSTPTAPPLSSTTTGQPTTTFIPTTSVPTVYMEPTKEPSTKLPTTKKPTTKPRRRRTQIPTVELIRTIDPTNYDDPPITSTADRNKNDPNENNNDDDGIAYLFTPTASPGGVRTSSASTEGSSRSIFHQMSHYTIVSIIVALTLLLLLGMLSLRMRRGYKRSKLCESSIFYSDLNDQNNNNNETSENYEDGGRSRHHELFILDDSNNSHGTIGKFRLPDQASITSQSTRRQARKQRKSRKRQQQLYRNKKGSKNKQEESIILVPSSDEDDDDHECSTNGHTPIVDNTEDTKKRRTTFNSDDKKTIKSDSTTSATNYSMVAVVANEVEKVVGSWKKKKKSRSPIYSPSSGDEAIMKVNVGNPNNIDPTTGRKDRNIFVRSSTGASGSLASPYGTPCTSSCNSATVTPPSSELGGTSSHSAASYNTMTSIKTNSKRNLLMMTTPPSSTRSFDASPTTSLTRKQYDHHQQRTQSQSKDTIKHYNRDNVTRAASLGGGLSSTLESYDVNQNQQPKQQMTREQKLLYHHQQQQKQRRETHTPIQSQSSLLQQRDEEVHSSDVNTRRPSPKKLVLPDAQANCADSTPIPRPDIVSKNYSLDNENSNGSSNIPAIMFQLNQGSQPFFQSRHQRLGGASPVTKKAINKIGNNTDTTVATTASANTSTVNNGRRLQLENIRQSLPQLPQRSGTSVAWSASQASSIENDSLASGLRGEDYLLTDLEDDETTTAASLARNLATDLASYHRDNSLFQQAHGNKKSQQPTIEKSSYETLKDRYHGQQKSQHQLNPMILPASSSSERSDNGSILTSSIMEPFQQWFQTPSWAQSFSFSSPNVSPEKHTTSIDDDFTASPTIKNVSPRNTGSASSQQHHAIHRSDQLNVSPEYNNNTRRSETTGKIQNHPSSHQQRSAKTYTNINNNVVSKQQNSYPLPSQLNYGNKVSNKNRGRDFGGDQRLHVMTYPDVIDGSIEILAEEWDEI